MGRPPHSAYYLFYSGGNFGDASYAMGYATALSHRDFAKASANPILKSTADAIGPGGAMRMFAVCSTQRIASG